MLNNKDKEDLRHLRDNCRDKFLEVVNTTTKEDVIEYCLTIANDEDLINLSMPAKTEKIALEAWERVKDRANDDELFNLSNYGKTEKIALEAWERVKDIANDKDLINLSKYGKTEKIALEAWERVKDKANDGELINLSEYGKHDNIANEAKDLLIKRPRCVGIEKFI